MEGIEHRGPEEQLEHDTEVLEKRLQHLGEGIEESRSQLKAREEAADDPHVRDWGEEDESQDEDEEAGGDPAAFDDPENVEEDEEV